MEGAVYKGRMEQIHCFLFNGQPDKPTFKAAKLVYDIYDLGNGQIINQLVYQQPTDPTEEQKKQVLAQLETARQNSASK
jgi:hypothetical protein